MSRPLSGTPTQRLKPINLKTLESLEVNKIMDFIIDNDKFLSLKAHISNALMEAILQADDPNKTSTVTVKVQISGDAPHALIHELGVIEYDVKVKTTQDIMSAKAAIEPCQARIVDNQLMFYCQNGQISMEDLG